MGGGGWRWGGVNRGRGRPRSLQMGGRKGWAGQGWRPEEATLKPELHHPPCTLGSTARRGKLAALSHPAYALQISNNRNLRTPAARPHLQCGRGLHPAARASGPAGALAPLPPRYRRAFECSAPPAVRVLVGLGLGWAGEVTGGVGWGGVGWDEAVCVWGGGWVGWDEAVCVCVCVGGAPGGG